MTAYAYLRKSSVHDPAREVSYEVQEAGVRALAAQYGDNNGALVLLSDWDKSGRLGADKRPGYRALLDAIESGRATAVYSYSLSRLARSVQELSRLIADCDARGIPVRLDRDHVDTTTASGKLLTNVLSSVAQFESDVASERVRGANAAKLARGQSLTTVRSYGDGNGDDAAAVLAAFREAGSFSGAAKLLNERGIKPRNSLRGWWPSAVAVVVKRLDPTIGTRKPTRGYAAGGTDFILARLLRCPTCGTLLTGTRDRDGRRVRYSCRLGTAKPHPRISVTESHILPAVQSEVARLAAPERVQADEDDEVQRQALEARKVRVVDLFDAGHIDRADRERRLQAVYDDMAKLDTHRVVLAVPEVDWDWEPRKLNAVLRALFESIALAPATFQPVAFQWTVPEWRRP
jgi:DNA invertase Pin-like site-specific DNA recombinase